MIYLVRFIWIKKKGGTIMDRRFFLPVIIMFLSVLLLGGLINFQAGSAQETPNSGGSAPVIGDKETVEQESPKADVQEPEQVNTNTSKEEAPEPSATMFFGGGGGVSAPTPSSTSLTSVVDIVVADFDYEIDGLNVTFTDNSQNASSWFWDFGDNTNSTEQSPEHEYENAGLYTVTLTAYGEDVLNNASTEMDIDLTSKKTEEGSEEGGIEEGGSEEKTPVTQEVPEFPTIAIPMAAIIGMAFIFSRRQ
jgi:FOG: PKD repeat